MFHQAVSRDTRARTQAMIRIGGEQGRAAVLTGIIRKVGNQRASGCV